MILEVITEIVAVQTVMGCGLVKSLWHIPATAHTASQSCVKIHRAVWKKKKKKKNNKKKCIDTKGFKIGFINEFSFELKSETRMGLRLNGVEVTQKSSRRIYKSGESENKHSSSQLGVLLKHINFKLHCFSCFCKSCPLDIRLKFS